MGEINSPLRGRHAGLAGHLYGHRTDDGAGTECDLPRAEGQPLSPREQMILSVTAEGAPSTRLPFLRAIEKQLAAIAESNPTRRLCESRRPSSEKVAQLIGSAKQTGIPVAW